MPVYPSAQIVYPTLLGPATELNPFSALQEGESPENLGCLPMAGSVCSGGGRSVLVWVSKDSGPHSPLIERSAESHFLFFFLNIFY